MSPIQKQDVRPGAQESPPSAIGFFIKLLGGCALGWMLATSPIFGVSQPRLTGYTVQGHMQYRALDVWDWQDYETGDTLPEAFVLRLNQATDAVRLTLSDGSKLHFSGLGAFAWSSHGLELLSGRLWVQTARQFPVQVGAHQVDFIQGTGGLARVGDVSKLLLKSADAYVSSEGKRVGLSNGMLATLGKASLTVEHLSFLTKPVTNVITSAAWDMHGFVQIGATEAEIPITRVFVGDTNASATNSLPKEGNLYRENRDQPLQSTNEMELYSVWTDPFSDSLPAVVPQAPSFRLPVRENAGQTRAPGLDDPRSRTPATADSNAQTTNADVPIQTISVWDDPYFQ